MFAHFYFNKQQLIMASSYHFNQQQPIIASALHMPSPSPPLTREPPTRSGSTNGAGPVSAEQMRDVGPYNMLLGEIPACPYHGR